MYHVAEGIRLTCRCHLGFCPDLGECAHYGFWGTFRLIKIKIVGLVFVGIFVLVRKRFPIIYAPRTFLGTILEK